jgi:hypothetical protein
LSFSGGVFSINTSGQPVVSGTTISASVFNALTADLATGLSTAILKDGTQTATAIVPFALGVTLGGGSTLSTYSESTFTATLTGCTTAPTGTVKYSKIGNIVTMDVPAFAATSNTTAKSLTGAPVAVRPAAQKIFVGVGRDNGGAYAGVEIVLETTGVINLYYNFENAWTGSGSFGVRQFSLSYTLA